MSPAPPEWSCQPSLPGSPDFLSGFIDLRRKKLRNNNPPPPISSCSPLPPLPGLREQAGRGLQLSGGFRGFGPLTLLEAEALGEELKAAVASLRSQSGHLETM